MVFKKKKCALIICTSRDFFYTVRNNLALSVFFVRLDGVSCGVTFKPVPLRASSLGRQLLSTTAVRLVAELHVDEAPILLSMPESQIEF